MQKRFYFPTSLDDALAVMRRQKRLDQVFCTDENPFLAYTDRDFVIRQMSQNSEHFGEEISLVIVEFPSTTLNELFMGDMVNFGSCATWLSEHIVELRDHAEDLLTQHGHVSLEIVPNSLHTARKTHAGRN
ncbi:MAG TPA: hypothetical protein V6C81_29275 [Planktothrix sp.]|jgi:hypothetical protein